MLHTPQPWRALHLHVPQPMRGMPASERHICRAGKDKETQVRTDSEIPGPKDIFWLCSSRSGQHSLATSFAVSAGAAASAGAESQCPERPVP